MVTDAPSRTRRAARVVVAVVLRLVGVLLLAASAVLGAQASWSRFGVCFGGDGPPVADLPADRAGDWCAYMQDHKYDYDVPGDPWIPIADAAQREGLSLIALGLGVAIVSLSLGGRWFVRLLTVVAGASFAAVWVGMGVPVLQSGLAGEPVGFDDWLSASALTVLTLLPALALTVLAWHHGGQDGRLVAVFWAALTVAQPLPEFFITLFLWGSHDTSPLNGLFRCAAVTVAAAAVTVTLVPVGSRPRLLPRPLRRVGRGAGRVLVRVGDNLTRGDTWREPRAER